MYEAVDECKKQKRYIEIVAFGSPISLATRLEQTIKREAIKTTLDRQFKYFPSISHQQLQTHNIYFSRSFQQNSLYYDDDEVS